MSVIAVYDVGECFFKKKDENHLMNKVRDVADGIFMLKISVIPAASGCLTLTVKMFNNTFVALVVSLPRTWELS